MKLKVKLSFSVIALFLFISVKYYSVKRITSFKNAFNIFQFFRIFWAVLQHTMTNVSLSLEHCRSGHQQQTQTQSWSRLSSCSWWAPPPSPPPAPAPPRCCLWWHGQYTPKCMDDIPAACVLSMYQTCKSFLVSPNLFIMLPPAIVISLSSLLFMVTRVITPSRTWNMFWVREQN